MEARRADVRGARREVRARGGLVTSCGMCDISNVLGARYDNLKENKNQDSEICLHPEIHIEI